MEYMDTIREYIRSFDRRTKGIPHRSAEIYIPQTYINSLAEQFPQFSFTKTNIYNSNMVLVKVDGK